MKNKKLIFLPIALFAIVLLNILASFFFFRIDLTSEKRFSLSDNTKKMMKSLDKPVNVIIYLDGDLNPGFLKLRKSTEELLQACRRYYEATNRRISFEYAMIDGVNDSEAAARLLLSRLKGLPAHMNLIPLNHVEESPLKPSSRKAVQRFQQILEQGGVPATVRRTLGGDIDASCGQLRRKYSKGQC